MRNPKMPNRKPANIEAAEKSDEQKVKDHKEQLINQMKQKQNNSGRKSTNKKPKKTSAKESKSTHELNRLRKQVADLERELKKAKKEAAADRKKAKAAKQQITATEVHAKNEIESARKEANALKKEAKESFDKAAEIMECLTEAGWDKESTAVAELQRRNLFINYLIYRRVGESRYLDSAQQRDHDFKKEIKALKQQVHTLENRNKDWSEIKKTHKKRIADLKLENDNLRKKHEQALARIRKLRKVNPQEMIPQLIRQLDNRTFRSFNQLNQLFEKYRWIFEYNAGHVKSEISDVLYGYLEVTEDEQFIFHDINDEVNLPLTVHKGYKRKDLLVDGMAIQVFRKLNEPEIVSLGYCYPIVDRQNVQERKTWKKQRASLGSKQEELLANPDVKAWASQLTITVVGNKQVQNFAELLIPYVKKVECIDAYEKGENRAFDLIRSADYAYVLIDSVPHSVTEFVKQYDPLEEKVQLFNRPSKQAGVVRLNYLYWNRTAQ